MKKILVILVVLLSASLVYAQTEGKTSGCKKKCPNSAACNKAGAKTTEVKVETETTGLETKTLCPSVAAGGTCPHPEKCTHSHDVDVASGDVVKCDHHEKKSWWKFWGSDEKHNCTCNKKP